MADIDRAFIDVAKTFKIIDFNEHQKTAIRTVVKENIDIFVNLPTGFGKSLIFQALPLIFDRLRTDKQEHIVVVVSPLINLITDQVNHLKELGITAINISGVEDEEEKKQVESGRFQVVFGTPEAWLLNQRWRDMLKNPVYASKLCAVAVDEAHVIKQWGTSTNNNLAPFRECYSRLHEFRALTSVPVIALTATATTATKNTIFNVLMMRQPKVIFESPNKGNIAYSVEYMSKDCELEYYFEWLADELKEKKEKCERTIIYCQTIRQCSLLYATMKGMLGKELYLVHGDMKTAFVEMLHSCTPLANKECILSSFSQASGTVRVLIATIAFGMGVDCKGVSRVIHFGPSKNIESYTQETGRAGRDGGQSTAHLLYNGILLAQVQSDMKSYVLNEHCRRAAILHNFDDNLSDVINKELHFCCDVCAKMCQCGSPECGKLTSFPAKNVESNQTNLRAREVTKSQREHVQNELYVYYKMLLRKLLNSTANGDVKTLTSIPYLIGFSEAQIQQVLQHLEHLFTLKDVSHFVEIWDMQHAYEILAIIKEVFHDTDVVVDIETDIEDFVLDDLFLEDWEALIEDDDLFERVIDNLSSSLLQDSLQSMGEGNVSDVGISQAVLDTLERVQVCDNITDTM